MRWRPTVPSSADPPLGAYRPGRSPVHRAPASWKLAGLGLGLGTLAWLHSWPALAAALAVLAVTTAVSGVGARALARQVRPVLWFAAFAAVLQVWLEGVLPAAVAVGSLLVGVAAAGLVTLTTRTQELLDAFVALLRPLRRAGVDPDRVGLVLALTIRSVPVIAALAEEVRDATRARGVERSPRAFAVPLLIRTLRHADRLGEALAARGVDD
jgi:biotin transport system permease protein